MTDFSYVRAHYGVPACFGRRVSISGKPGIIVEDRGHHIGVNFDADKPGISLPCHPTSNVKYLGMGKPRKMPRSQQRYQDFIRCADVFNDDFRAYLKYLSTKEGNAE